MAAWDNGYVTDVVYTSNFHRETTPAWLAASSLLLGHRPPDLSRPFRYADLGCGNGLTALVVAATSPQAEVWGFDFNPAHIETARALAASAGLGNVHFEEASFAELAALPSAALPAFDIIVSHGVLSWVAPDTRQHMLAVIRQRLRAGGLLYLSYNVATGWVGVAPLRQLMRLLAEASPARSDQAAGDILDRLDRLKSAGALFFQANPMLEPRLQEMRRQDPRYLAHEFLNRDWHPLMFAEVAAALAECKCSYIGSATLAENIDAASVPSGMQPMLAETDDPVLRETLRDVATGQGFRRDLYRRGLAPMPPGEHQALLEAMQLASTGLEPPDPLTFATPIGSITGRAELYRPLQQRLQQGPITLRSLRDAPPFADRPVVEALQAISLMMAGGYAHPVLPNPLPAVAPARALNRAIAAGNADGNELPRLVVPLLGSALPVDVAETLLVGALLEGRPPRAELLCADLLAMLARGGRAMQQDGRSVEDPVEASRLALQAARHFLAYRLPVLRGLGVLDG